MEGLSDDVLALVHKLQNQSEPGKLVSDSDRLSAFCELMKSGKLQTLVYALPLLLNLDNKPYTLKEHCQFEPIFRLRRPKKTLLITGRQTSKTTTEAADGVLQANCIPNFKIVYITPLFEQVRRLSTDRVRKFIEQSPVKHLWTDSKTENSVLRKSFTNFSTMHFSFALQDADRVRGLSADSLKYDEIQDMDREHLPVIDECLSHSKWKWIQYAGTPKTPENTISALHNSSSQAEWVIPCRHCKKDNICCSEWHLDKIIGEWREDISAESPATVCAHCRKMIFPGDGFWLHRYPERRWDFAGYHIPQPIMHIHYSDPSAWADLLSKRAGGNGSYSPARYFNEVLGESCGTGVQLVSMDQLKEASRLPWENRPDDPEEQSKMARKYHFKVLAIDWGGGGKRKSGDTEMSISLTTLAVLGWLPNGEIHVIWGKRLMTPHDHMGEAKQCLEIFRKFRCDYIAHDYTGAGSLRETFLRHNRIPLEKIVPIAYVGAAKHGILTHKPATEIHPRAHYIADKTRSLLHTIASIIKGKLRFFKYDWVSPENPGLTSDFLSLIENNVETARAGKIYTIIGNSMTSDDFAHAVNLGCCCLWERTGHWPFLGEDGHAPTDEQYRAMEPESNEDWDVEDG